MKSMSYDIPIQRRDTFPLGPPVKARHGQACSPGGGK
ncbi:hypothetical protein LCGC14_0474540 [marine sediment metagenome]|uniref:Uncharacterized protein n=1 Tax=marine sediment metagenome TaxID=412755 RepID=A0A0F9SGH7_9ZZZZ